MGRNSGGVSGSGAGKVKANKGATETGYTAKMVKEFNKVSNKVFKNNSDYVYKQGYSQSAADRAEVTHFHLVMKAMSKKYGWEYSKKKG